MANIAIFKPNKTPEYLRSVNTPDYSSDPDVLVNPDISALQSIPHKYWKRVGNAVQEMTAGEKATVDTQEQALRDAAVNDLHIDTVILAKALVKAGVITKNALINAIKQVQ